MKIKLRGLTIVSLLMMMGALWLVKIKFDYLEIRDQGKLVQVDVFDVPVKCGNKYRSRFNKPHFRFNYGGKTYEKNFYGQHCNDVKRGSKLMLRTNSDRSVFLFEDEKIEYDIASFLGVTVVLLICAVASQLRKEEY